MIDWDKIDKEKLTKDLSEALTEALMSLFHFDEEGRLWAVDKNGNKTVQIRLTESPKKEEPYNERKTIEEASKMSLQKKEERLVINLPAWLKDRLKNKAKQAGQSMNEIIRLALTEYLAK